ncbi:MAG TPA: transporter substrate-binding domain-containing protein [Acetobacteraceae bacterium]|nr:transporter substrate-binding domain-containing protein [Acetobacteraceae bacterium]
MPSAPIRGLCILLLAAAALFGPVWSAHSQTDDTLRLVRARGALRCGVSEGILGFSFRDRSGVWSGIDVDFCRALAAAALGDPAKVRFVPLRAPARFPALMSREIDILARNTTWTVQREADFGVSFVGVLFFDDAALVARADNRFARAATLDGARLCYERTGSDLDDAETYFRARGWHSVARESPDLAASRRDLQEGACDLLVDDASSIAEMLLRVPNRADFVVRPERLGRQPLGPAVRVSDGTWLTLVRAVYAALIDAEQRGLTQPQAREMLRGEDAPAHPRYMQQTASVARALRIAPTWAVAAVAAVGNYGEMFERNLGAASQLRLPRGENRPWTAGGLLFAPPFD